MAVDCIVVLSGGMDSTVLLYDILDRGRNAAVLSFNYGSRHNARELPLAAKTCESIGVQHRIIELLFIGEFFSSALLKKGGIPDGAMAGTAIFPGGAEKRWLAVDLPVF